MGQVNAATQRNASASEELAATAEELSEGQDKVRYFEGFPIPTSVLLVGLLAFAGWQGRIGARLYFGMVNLGPFDLHPLALIFLVWGGLMISKTLRIFKV